MGLTAIAIWLGSIARTAVSQDWANWVFDRNLHGQPATVSEYLKSRLEPHTITKPPVTQPPVAQERPPAPAPAPEQKPPVIGTGDLIGRLAIPRLKLQAIVREGAGAGTLDLALGHIPGTAFPGQQGNVGVAGHRDSLFRGLGQIRKTDRIEFQTLSGKYAYEVESTSIVKPQKVSVLDPGQYPEITLVTCYPFHYVGSAPNRFIVKARLVSQNAPQNAPPNAEKEPVKPPAEQEAKPTAEQVKPAEPETKPAQTEAKPAEPEVKPAAKPVKPARVAARRGIQTSARKVFFHVSEGHSQALVSGISLGLQWADPASQRMNGWMWVVPDRRTIWLTSQHTHEPLVFYGRQDGKRRELVITSIGRNSVSGYLQLGG
jgi:sortase A